MWAFSSSAASQILYVTVDSQFCFLRYLLVTTEACFLFFFVYLYSLSLTKCISNPNLTLDTRCELWSLIVNVLSFLNILNDLLDISCNTSHIWNEQKHWQRLCGCMILRSSWICKKECKCKMDWMIVIIVVWGPVTIYVLLFCRWSFGATTDGWTANASWASLESYWRSWTSAQWWLAGTSSSLPPPWWTQRWRRSSATPLRCPWRAPLGPAVSDPKTRAKI